MHNYWYRLLLTESLPRHGSKLSTAQKGPESTFRVEAQMDGKMSLMGQKVPRGRKPQHNGSAVETGE